MKYLIHGNAITFDNIIKGGHTSEVRVSEDKQYIIKKVIHFLDHNCYEREVHVLTFLNEQQFDWCPKLLKTFDNERSFIMNYCGERINKSNKPTDYKQQIQKILDDMQLINLKHNDIKNTEVMVYKGKVFIIDFGWASINDDFSCGVKGVSSKKKPCGIFDDKRVLNF